MVWLAWLELDGAAANGAVSRKAHQARPAVIVMPEHFQLAAGFAERGYPVGGFDDAVVNDAEPGGVNLPPDEYKPGQGKSQSDEASHGEGAITLAQGEQHDREEQYPECAAQKEGAQKAETSEAQVAHFATL